MEINIILCESGCGIFDLHLSFISLRFKWKLKENNKRSITELALILFMRALARIAETTTVTYTLENWDNAPSERTQSLPASSRESSTGPMDTDDAQRASEEIYHRIRHQAGLSTSGSAGDVTLQPENLGVMTQGRLILHRTFEQPQAAQSDTRD